MKYKTSELKGGSLDAAVVMAQGDMDVDLNGLPRAVMIHHGSDSRIYSPSTQWFDGGPIIERERIELTRNYSPAGWASGSHWAAFIRSADGRSDGLAHGDTALIAAMRAYVMSKFGKEVELP